jgi:hypothetical protein
MSSNLALQVDNYTANKYLSEPGDETGVAEKTTKVAQRDDRLPEIQDGEDEDGKQSNSRVEAQEAKGLDIRP